MANLHPARLLLLPLIAMLVTLSTPPVDAQSRSVAFARRDAEITLQANGDARFVETWEVKFTGGPFTNATRAVGTRNVEGISDVAVAEGAQTFTQSSSGNANTFSVTLESSQTSIKWFYAPATDQTRTFRISYTMRGVIRQYEGGDQFWPEVIESNKPSDVPNSTITLRLPTTFTLDQIKAQASLARAQVSIPDGKTVVVKTNPVFRAETLEVRVQFPHGAISAPPPKWQAAYDQEAVARDEQARRDAEARAARDQQAAIFNVIFIFTALIILIAGPLALFLLWYVKGRDPSVAIAAQTSKPPSDLPPGVVGTLIDESADMHDILATLVDLARRGVIKMTEKQETDGATDFAFELVGNQTGLRKYEQTILTKVFGGNTTRWLSELKEQFYTAIGVIKDQMFEEVTRLGYYAGNPQTTRRLYGGLGCGALVFAGLCGFALLAVFGEITETAFCVGLAMGATAIGLLVISPFMPQRTPRGATERAKWRAFQRYLESIEKFTKLETAQDLFEKYLPYAVTFGLEKSFTEKFAAVGAPAPVWYETATPYYPGFPRRDYDERSADSLSRESGGASGAPSAESRGSGAPSLDRMTDGAFRGLNSMTTGFFTMLNTTATVLTSTPAPSSSGGSDSGDWSGGGSSGWSSGGGSSSSSGGGGSSSFG